MTPVSRKNTESNELEQELDEKVLDTEFDWTTLETNPAVTSLIPESLARKYIAFPARIE